MNELQLSVINRLRKEIKESSDMIFDLTNDLEDKIDDMYPTGNFKKAANKVLLSLFWLDVLEGKIKPGECENKDWAIRVESDLDIWLDSKDELDIEDKTSASE